MKNIKNKVIGFLINLLFSLIWFIVSIYIWDYVDAWLEYKNSFYEVFWGTGYYIFIPIPITFLLIFSAPYFFIYKYNLVNKNLEGRSKQQSVERYSK